jgi:alpha-mannosidase
MVRTTTAIAAGLLALGSTVVCAGEAAAHPIEKNYVAVGYTPGPLSKVFGKGFYQGVVNEPGTTMSIDACDLVADGKRVVVRVYNSSRSYRVQDDNGSETLVCGGKTCRT